MANGLIAIHLQQRGMGRLGVSRDLMRSVEQDQVLELKKLSHGQYVEVYIVLEPAKKSR